MEWSNEEQKSLCGLLMRRCPDFGQRGSLGDIVSIEIATRAVELVAARGGTMTAEQLEHTLKNIGNPMTNGALLRQHIAAQGARIAELEASAARAISTEVGHMSDGERAQYLKGHEDGAEAMRAACLEEVLGQLQVFGMTGGLFESAVKRAIEGAAP